MKHLLRRGLSLCLCLIMLIGLLPVVPTNAASTVTVYFKDSDNWGQVYGYVWDAKGTTLLGSWPGTALTKQSNGLYALTVDYTPSSSNSFNFIFNNNAGSQTADLTLSYAQLTSGDSYWVSGGSGTPVKYRLPSASGNTVTFTYESSSAKSVYVAGTMNGWSTSANKMTKSGNIFTCTMELTSGEYEYKFVADGNWLCDPCNPLTVGENGNSYFVMPGMQGKTVSATRGQAFSLPAELSYTDASGKTMVTAVSYTVPSEYQSFVTLNGTTATVSSAYTGSSLHLTATNSSGATAKVTVDLSGTATGTTVILHFLNTPAWDAVCGYAWSSSGTVAQSWPGTVLNRDEDGYYTMTLQENFAQGETLGFLFHNNNGTQTVDMSISAAKLATGKVEAWVGLTGSTNEEGKLGASWADSASGIFHPVEFGDGTVTFRYRGSASKVYLAGCFNGWSTSSTPLKKGSDGIWSVTVDLQPGVYEYKYVVNGEWCHDPDNGLVGGYDGNSVLVVPTGEAPEDTGKITVMLHFYRESGSYTGWDVWYWGEETSGAAAFQTVTYDKGMVATFTVDGNKNSNVGYLVRKTDWSDKEFYDRFIDLSDISSGTVHYFLNSGSATGSRILGADVIMSAKMRYANYDYDSGRIWAELTVPYDGAVSTAFSLTGGDVTVTGVEVAQGGYWLTLSRKLKLEELGNYQVQFLSSRCSITTDGLFYSSGFAADYTYNGDDLGATWSKDSTTFKVWAPTAQNVHVKLYKSGNYGANDQLQYVQMKQGDKGVWYVTVSGDLHGVYYNFDVTFPTYTVEATDPYANATGANGDRGMIVNWDEVNPEGWENDTSPNKNMSYTDAIIYEMHIREMTIDASSGVKEEWRGKYLGLTQSGTNYNGYSTALEHLKELGVTHVQLMPTFDFNSADEYKLEEWEQYAWGYDPKNYNVPDGSYSTDPFNGSVRITEFKQMVQTLHSNGINVIMDVVYNHTFSGGDFCYNKIVPNYFSRFFGEGNWSNGSGVGNDFATERAMARNFIVDSVMHWVEEYHIDGFRFDLAGLIDTQTINEIERTIHAKYPNVILYGEGWGVGDTAVESGYTLATKHNAGSVPGFAFFNDDYRNAIAGDNGNSWGFASGSSDFADRIGSHFRASNGWSTSPTQTINYVSCHDNYSLMDKLLISKNGSDWLDLVKMNDLSAAIYMLSQGTAFMYSGEELLREKKDQSGNRHDNAYGTDDYVNKIRWSDLQDKTYAQMADDYYCGLIEFRKNHAALRCPGGADAWNYTTYHKINDQVIMFYVNGYPNYECSDGIVIIFNASNQTQWIDLYRYGIPTGYWQATIHGTQAGNEALWGMDVTSSSGTVGVEGISTTVLVLGELEDKDSVYVQNKELVSCSHTSHNQSGVCTTCGATVAHTYTTKVTKPTCTAAGYTTYTCSVCGKTYKANDTAALGHKWVDASCTAAKTCSVCGITEGTVAGHKYDAAVTAPDCANGGYTTYTCSVCGDSYTAEETEALGHSYDVTVTDATCTQDGQLLYTCTVCGHSYTETMTAPGHDYKDGYCLACGERDPNAITMPTLKLLYGSVSFEDEIWYNMYFSVSNTENIRRMGLLVFDTEMPDGTMVDAIQVITNYSFDGTTHMAHTDGIAAKNMGDTLYFKLFAAMDDGSYVYSDMVSYSAVSYANSILRKSENPYMKALVVSMLNYGAEAQKYFNYRTDSLMNAGLTEEQQALARIYDADTMPDPGTVDGDKNPSFIKRGFTDCYVTASFDSAFAMNYYFTTWFVPEGDVTLYYWTAEDYANADVLEPETATGSMVMTPTGTENQYFAALTGIAAKEMSDTVYVGAIYNYSGMVYHTAMINYSMGKYCDTIAGRETSAQRELSMAAAVYGASARDYFDNL